jgi:hypothetical protein
LSDEGLRRHGVCGHNFVSAVPGLSAALGERSPKVIGFTSVEPIPTSRYSLPRAPGPVEEDLTSSSFETEILEGALRAAGSSGAH